jgi:hypothetical protein
MHVSSLRRSFTLVVVAAVAGIGCRAPTRPATRQALDPQLAAGTYVLETVSGRGPISGAFVLTSFGGAERRVQYAAAPGTTAPLLVATGTFQVYADSIEFALREAGGTSAYLWHPRGERSAERFNIRHGDPADGPDIVETYRRQ